MCRDAARKRLYRIRHLNGHAWVRPGSAIADQLILSGEYEPTIVSAIQRFMASGFSFVDVGANVGLHTLAASFARVDNSQRIFAFEPEPATFAVLTRNVSSNGLQNVHCTNAAAGAHAGSLTLNVSDGVNEGAHTFLKRDHTAAGPTVSVLTLDEFLTAMDPPVDDRFLMKIDVEGYEPAVISGALDLFCRASTFGVLVEIFPQLLASWGKTPDDIIAPLKACGADRVVKIPDKDAHTSANASFYNILVTKGPAAATLADSLRREQRA